MRGSGSGRVYRLCVTLALALAGSAHGAAFTNGSFESASVNPGSFTNLSSGSTAITGWTVRSSDIDYIGSYWVSADGGRSLDLSGATAGGIEQTFDTIPGVLYQVHFFLAGNPGCGNVVKGLDVGATGNPTSHYTFDTTGYNTYYMGWRLETYTFVASGTSTTLYFQSTESSACGPALDAVSVEIPPVPASSPSLLVGLAAIIAVLALAALARR